MTTENSGAAAQPFDFEAAVSELEALVAQLESGKLPLDASLDAYRRGSQLLVACRERLAAVRQHVDMLDGEVLRAFDSGDGA
ncbi:MAG: exodeoxyribonuclease VII small subunit [Betaproteobacteria bacterium]|jgi:exodeoxyribonuclease VII small subunit|nr:exodeoxyribonuclease VII small subunit [Betaproteobacteria bacterium]